MRIIDKIFITVFEFFDRLNEKVEAVMNFDINQNKKRKKWIE